MTAMEGIARAPPNLFNQALRSPKLPQKRQYGSVPFFFLNIFFLKFAPVNPQTAYFVLRMNRSVTATRVS